MNPETLPLDLLGHFGSKKDDDGATKTKAQKRQRAVRKL